MLVKENVRNNLGIFLLHNLLPRFKVPTPLVEILSSLIRQPLFRQGQLVKNPSHATGPFKIIHKCHTSISVKGGRRLDYYRNRVVRGVKPS
jgi:hypothetical protein